MRVVSLLKTIAFSAGLALAATASQAATVATFSSGGTVTSATNGTGYAAQGTFTGQFLDPGLNPFAKDNYRLNATLTVNSVTVFSGVETAQNSTIFELRPLIFAGVVSLEPSFVPAVPGILAVVSANTGAITPVGGGIFSSFSSTGPIPQPGGFTESFSGYVGDVMSPIFNSQPMTYSLSVDIERVAPVPLPATLPMLALAGLGLGAIARRRKTG
ncbi:hypothetical protein [Roseobacter sinensis]|uniref:Uncharacterized protein n=1 Tax=Roseobacter sinensis TaxID=2931391 RepID=A0ABT3B9V3_9RHOB|nr:hypothetical protein [Roseobacter sp. WL0113]MCV3269984.1 hypothetical protein [Roseobacter sp. WL0113]